MTKRLCLPVALCVGIAAFPSPADARRLENWPYDKLMKEADLVLIATAVKTETNKELLGDPQWPFDFIGQDTTFKVEHVLKGKAEGQQIKVLHFKLGKQLINNGPLFVAFRDKSVVAEINEATVKLGVPEYLLYLKRQKGGRYEPVSGRIDPALSVRELSEPLDRVLGGK